MEVTAPSKTTTPGSAAHPRDWAPKSETPELLVHFKIYRQRDTRASLQRPAPQQELLSWEVGRVRAEFRSHANPTGPARSVCTNSRCCPGVGNGKN